MTNPLKSAKAHFKSCYRASDYARFAREKGMKLHAEAWEKADLEGWDDLHFSQELHDKTMREHPPSKFAMRGQAVGL